MIYIYRRDITDSTFLTIRVLYNFKSSLNDTVYKYYAIATRVNRSKSTGTTKSTGRRHYRYKEERKRGKLEKKELYSNNEGKEEPFYLALGARAREGEYYIIKSTWI